MKCPICGGKAHYMPEVGIIVGRGFIVCEKGHVTKGYHLAVSIKEGYAEAIVFTNKKDLENAIEESGSEELKRFYKYVKRIYVF